MFKQSKLSLSSVQIKCISHSISVRKRGRKKGCRSKAAMSLELVFFHVMLSSTSRQDVFKSRTLSFSPMFPRGPGKVRQPIIICCQKVQLKQFEDFISYLLEIQEKKIATHSNTLAWRIPWTEEPGGLQSIGLPTVRHD